MSVQTEINRIKTAVTAIVNAIKGKGVSVPSSAKINDLASYIEDIPQFIDGGGGDTIDTCTVILDVGTFSAFTPNGVRVFFTAYGDGLSAEFKEVNPNERSEIYLYNVVCGSAISIYTDTSGASDATSVRYTNEHTHYIIAPSVAGATERITFTETS